MGGTQFGVSATAFRWPITPHARDSRSLALFHAFHNVPPGSRRLRRAGVIDGGFGIGEQDVERWRHVFRFDVAEAGQVGEVEQGLP